MKRETRRAAIRALADEPGVTLRAITPNIVDDYGSVFMPDTFDASLAVRMPTLCWSHDWAEPLGPPRSWRTAEDGSPEIEFAFSDFEAVPMARRAHAQVIDGTLTDCSVGFSNTVRRPPTEDEIKRWPGVREVITRADLDEVSLVLRGAVPGARVVNVRSGQVTEEQWLTIARKLAAGEITEDEARAAMRLLAEEPPATDAPPTDDQPTTEPPPDLTADIDAALESIGRSAPRREARFADLMADDVRRMLDIALRDRLMPTPGEQWVWIRDFSDTVVVFDTEGTGWSGTYSLGYSLSGGIVVLSSESPRRVVPKTTYTET